MCRDAHSDLEASVKITSVTGKLQDQTVGLSFFATCILVCLSSRVINQTLKGMQQVPTSEAGVGRALEDRDSFC